jgi:ureidoglycolate lyase
MRTIPLEPLTPEAFAPFGDVLVPPPEPGRNYFADALASARPAARPSLSVATVGAASALPLTARKMERHAHSSQSFMPLGAADYLVVVAPHGADGRPDTGAARAFHATNGMGVTYRMDTWHHPLTVLSAPCRFAIFMWLDGSSTDEEFVDIDPFVVEAR